MAIVIDVEQPGEFLIDMKSKIESGLIESWLFDNDGDMTCLSFNMENKAWFHPYFVSDDRLVFGILGRKNVLMTMSEYAIYHSCFIDTLLYFYSKRIKSIRVTVPFENEHDTRKIDY